MANLFPEFRKHAADFFVSLFKFTADVNKKWCVKLNNEEDIENTRESRQRKTEVKKKQNLNMNLIFAVL